MSILVEDMNFALKMLQRIAEALESIAHHLDHMPRA